ncbi:Gfo/Idh/MocA family oxidoreductase [Streptomyces sp. B93]|uniref:Gfo/Idh/MocA family oxidoreductase n=1 Tax=Streptomyces sp. B93 TaxID=2824875 RepID=UPI001B37A77C|nr:Gfo/Idh/MocA family oxidoreductase [Streptomyces sp. B93]MBQ1093379.1 Gfo/Idh/MocA family oxidoreductase [Streptomyces sp. B93]
MERTLIIGLGRAGLGLHWAVLRRLRATGRHTHLLDPAPALCLDPLVPVTAPPAEGLRPVASIAEARTLLDPEHTVVHICTPPVARLDLLRELAAAGFRRIIVEKPLAAGRDTAHDVLDLARTERLRLSVVAPWLASALTARLVRLVDGGTLGELRSIEVRQYKPRMRRTLADKGHPTAFDIEPPHSLGVCLRLAGDAHLTHAQLDDMRIGDTVIPSMGRARLELRHRTAVSRIVSDLTAPVRERSMRLEFTHGHVVAHYPNAEDDHYAQLRVSRPGHPETWEVFPDDALSAYLLGAYRALRDDTPLEPQLQLGVRVVELLADAKTASGAARAAAQRSGGQVAHAG